MKQVLAITALLFFVSSCDSGVQKYQKNSQKEKVYNGAYCYMRVEKNLDTSIIVLNIDRDNVTGEIIYSTKDTSGSLGKMKGTKEQNVITADWFMQQGDKYYKIPVAFKLEDSILWQKPTSVDDSGNAYVPDYGQFNTRFDEVSCLNVELK